MEWEELLYLANEVFGAVDDSEEESCIICPDCGEPIYKDDYMGEGLCPVCDFDFEKEAGW